MIKQFSFMTIPMTRERSNVKQIDGQTGINYNHTFCQWWLIVVIKNCSQVFIVLAQLLKYLQIDCNILPWHGSPICCWPFVRGIHWSSMDSPHKRLAAQALIFSLMLAWTNCWTNMPVPGWFVMTHMWKCLQIYCNIYPFQGMQEVRRRRHFASQSALEKVGDICRLQEGTSWGMRGGGGCCGGGVVVVGCAWGPARRGFFGVARWAGGWGLCEAWGS